jgi:hypothetical protein
MTFSKLHNTGADFTHGINTEFVIVLVYLKTNENTFSYHLTCIFTLTDVEHRSKNIVLRTTFLPYSTTPVSLAFNRSSGKVYQNYTYHQLPTFNNKLLSSRKTKLIPFIKCY